MHNNLITLMHQRDNAWTSIYEGQPGQEDYVNLSNARAGVEAEALQYSFVPLDIIAEAPEDDTGGNLVIITALFPSVDGSCAWVLLHTEDDKPVEDGTCFLTIGQAIAAARNAHPSMFEIDLAEGIAAECAFVVARDSSDAWAWYNDLEGAKSKARGACADQGGTFEVFEARRVTGYRKTLEEF